MRAVPAGRLRPPPQPPVGPAPYGGGALDFLLLAVAVSGISLSGPLIVATAAPVLAIAFWRNALAVGALTPLVLLRHRTALRGMSRRALLLSAAAGALLAAHFALWLPSLRMTSVASSTALVTTTPIWTILLLRLRGHRPPAAVWAGSAVAFAGVLLLTGVDLSLSPRALLGDALALCGGMTAAVYVLLGAEVRRSVGTTVYSWVCYGSAALLLLAFAVPSGTALVGWPAQTWLKLLLLTVSAQLLGHTLLNRVVRGLGPSITSTAILLETPGAALIAALWLGQVPPVAASAALLVILAGLLLVIRASRSAGTPGGSPGRCRR